MLIISRRPGVWIGCSKRCRGFSAMGAPQFTAKVTLNDGIHSFLPAN
jgi:hypothetical protein